MSEYIVFTDSCCDVRPAVLQEWGVPYASMTFSFDGDDRAYIDTDISNKDFYDRMRKGSVVKTAAINADTFTRAFEPILKEGKDILYVAFSSGLSTTVNSAHIAVADLQESYPERKIVVVDTLAASAGGGLMVYAAVQKKKEGAAPLHLVHRGRFGISEARWPCQPSGCLCRWHFGHQAHVADGR